MIFSYIISTEGIVTYHWPRAVTRVTTTDRREL
jgi:hypothetical protein